MKLNELEALAKAAIVCMESDNPDDYDPVVAFAFYKAASPETILQMIALIRQMESALKYYDFGNGVPQKALEALKEFDK